jgi:hypothetical protein
VPAEAPNGTERCRTARRPPGRARLQVPGLVTFRQFILRDEPVEVGRVANIVWQRLTGDEPRVQLARARRRYNTELRTGGLGFVLNDKRFRPEEILALWINGRYFHNDERKAAAIDALDPMSTIFVRHVFLGVLVEATRFIVFLANVIVIAQRDGLWQSPSVGERGSILDADTLVEIVVQRVILAPS